MEKAGNYICSPNHTFVVVTSVVFLFMSKLIPALEILPCDHQLEREFLSAENKELQQVSYRQTVTRSYVHCVSYCHADPRCLSVNYHIDNHLCDQNNATRARYPDHFITHYGSVYFDADVDTPLLSLPDPKPFAPPDTPSPLQPRYSSCTKLLEAGHVESDIFTIFPVGFRDGLRVYCDMETDGGGWIVFQRRQDGSVDFYRNWTDYRVGFGDLDGEFWLGNDNLRGMTESEGMWKMRIYFENWLDQKAWSEYEGFRISGDNFRLHVDSFNDNSTAGDSILHDRKAKFIHNGMMFSTRDKKNDNHKFGCAEKYHGAWWYNSCFVSNLNGRYYVGEQTLLDGMHWDAWNNDKTVKKCAMKLRAVD